MSESDTDNLTEEKPQSQSRKFSRMASSKVPKVPEFDLESKNLAQFLIELQGWCDCVEDVVDKEKQAHMIAL